MIHNNSLLTWQAWKLRIVVFAWLIVIQSLGILPIWQMIGLYPSLFLIVVYHWIIYHPRLLPVEQIILFSLLQDGIYAYPLGFSALRLLLDYTLLAVQKKILGPQKFLWSWAGFAFFMVADNLLYFLLLSFIKKEWINLFSLTPGMIMTISLYPLIVKCSNKFIVRHFP